MSTLKTTRTYKVLEGSMSSQTLQTKIELKSIGDMMTYLDASIYAASEAGAVINYDEDILYDDTNIATEYPPVNNVDIESDTGILIASAPDGQATSIAFHQDVDQCGFVQVGSEPTYQPFEANFAFMNMSISTEPGILVSNSPIINGDNIGFILTGDVVVQMIAAGVTDNLDGTWTMDASSVVGVEIPTNAYTIDAKVEFSISGGFLEASSSGDVFSVVHVAPSYIDDFAATDDDVESITFTFSRAMDTATYDLHNTSGLVQAGITSGFSLDFVGGNTDTYHVIANGSDGNTPSNTDEGIAQEGERLATAPTSFVASDSEVGYIGFTWVTPSDQGFPAASYEVRNDEDVVVATANVGETSATYSIEGPFTDTFYVVAVNTLGASLPSNTDDGSAEEQPVTPTAPSLFSASDGSVGEMTFAWTAPTDDGVPNGTFSVRNASGTEVATALVGETTATWTTAGPVSNSYYVVCLNSNGTSPQSNSNNGSIAGVAGAPTVFSASDGSVNSIEFSWTIPSEQGIPVCTYEVRNDSSIVVATAAAGATSASLSITGPDTDIYYVVGVNSQGDSPISNTDSGTAVPTAYVPNAPTSFNASDSTVGSISCTWTLPTDQGSPTCTYEVYGSTRGLVAVASAGQTSAVWTIAGPVTETLWVVGVNSAGSGASSNTNSGTSIQANVAPSVPNSFTASDGNTDYIDFAWGAPTSGYPTTYTYDIRGSSSGAIANAVSGTSYRWSGSGARSETFYIHATNAGGDGPEASDVGSSIAPTVAPSAPQNFAASDGQVGQILFSYGQPSTGNPASYTYNISGAAMGHITTTGSLNYTLTGLTTESDTFYVSASNTAGTGPAASDYGYSTAPSVIPSAPQSFSASDGQTDYISFSWAAPATGSPTNYTYTIAGSVSGQVTTTTSTSYHWASTGAKSETFYITATNTAGTGPSASDAGSSIAPTRAPGAPTGFAASDSTVGLISFSWALPSDQGSPTCTYKVMEGSTVRATAVAGATSASWSVTGPYTGTFHVVSTNSAGDSSASNTNSGTSAEVPAAPGSQIFTASGTFTVPAGVTSVTLCMVAGGQGGYSVFCNDWTATAAPGGSAGQVVSTTVSGLTPNSTVPITVGTGGPGRQGDGNDGPGLSGIHSLFGTYATAEPVVAPFNGDEEAVSTCGGTGYNGEAYQYNVCHTAQVQYGGQSSGFGNGGDNDSGAGVGSGAGGGDPEPTGGGTYAGGRGEVRISWG